MWLRMIFYINGFVILAMTYGMLLLLSAMIAMNGRFTLNSTSGTGAWKLKATTFKFVNAMKTVPSSLTSIEACC